MGRHDRRDRGHRGSYAGRDEGGSRMASGPAVSLARPSLSRRLPKAVLLVGFMLWSLLAWAGYALVDPVLGLAQYTGGLLVDGGKDLANATGAGKEVGTVLDSLGIGGILGTTMATIQAVLKPTIVVIWAIGALLIFAASALLPRVAGLLGGRRD